MSLQETYKTGILVLDDTHITFNEYQTDTCQKTYFNDIFIDYDLGEIQNRWNSQLLVHCALSDTTDTCRELTAKLHSAMESMFTSTVCTSWRDSIEKAISNYEEDQLEASKTTFSICSINSLKQFVRYIPNFNSLHHNVYIDKDSGFFGIVLKSSKKSKPMLNLLLQDNGEVTFSFIERKKGMIKISGRAHFNHNLEDSQQIKHLLRMIKL